MSGFIFDKMKWWGGKVKYISMSKELLYVRSLDINFFKKKKDEEDVNNKKESTNQHLGLGMDPEQTSNPSPSFYTRWI